MGFVELLLLPPQPDNTESTKTNDGIRVVENNRDVHELQFPDFIFPPERMLRDRRLFVIVGARI
jgi:hypothetical protein